MKKAGKDETPATIRSMADTSDVEVDDESMITRPDHAAANPGGAVVVPLRAVHVSWPGVAELGSRRTVRRPSQTVKTFFAQTADQWRDWLVEHHDSESEVWLIFHKLHTGMASITYADALDEALCFGWVDSLVKRLDDRRYARKFTPRRADSRWSTTNRKRYALLKARGRMTPAGINRAPTDRSYGPPPRFKMPSKLPPYIQTALKKHPEALRYFEALAPSHRRRYVGWIDSAKHQETKTRRLEEAIRLLSAGKVLGLK